MSERGMWIFKHTRKHAVPFGRRRLPGEASSGEGACWQQEELGGCEPLGGRRKRKPGCELRVEGDTLWVPLPAGADPHPETSWAGAGVGSHFLFPDDR